MQRHSHTPYGVSGADRVKLCLTANSKEFGQVCQEYIYIRYLIHFPGVPLVYFSVVPMKSKQTIYRCEC